MTSEAFIKALVKALADRYGFDLDEATVQLAAYRDAYVVTLFDRPVDEFEQFTIAARDVLGVDREALARALDAQFARARRAVDDRVLGPAYGTAEALADWLPAGTSQRAFYAREPQ